MTESEQALEQLIAEREKTHGSFAVTAKISQELKAVIHAYNTPIVSNAQIEALDMMCSKIARILNGNPQERDHWIDIAGYARLGEEACE